MMPYESRRLMALVARNVAILTVGAILVLGFFYHGEFYQLGLPTLVAVGAILVFIIIRLTQWLSGFEMNIPTHGFMLFPPEDVEPILSGVKRQTIRLDRTGSPFASDALFSAKVGVMSPRNFAVLRIVGVRRKLLADVTRDEARREGVGDRQVFQRAWEDRHCGWEPDTQVAVIRFRVVDAA